VDCCLGAITWPRSPTSIAIRVAAARSARNSSRKIRSAIVARRLSPGARLPSTRAVAERFGVSRNTLTEAFDQLLAEGFLIARHGSGTSVSPALRDSPLGNTRRTPTSWKHVSSRGKLFGEITLRTRSFDKEPRAFQPGVPAVDLFPFATRSRIAGRLLP